MPLTEIRVVVDVSSEFNNEKILIGRFQKKPKQEGLGIYFSETSPGTFRFVFLSLEISENASFHPWKLCKIV